MKPFASAAISTRSECPNQNDAPNLTVYDRPVVLPQVVEADADFPDVAGRIRWFAKADEGVHFTKKALGAVGRLEPDAAMTRMCFELIEAVKGVTVHIEIDATVSMTLPAVSNLRALDHVIEFCRPVDDWVLAEVHVSPGAGASFAHKRKRGCQFRKDRSRNFAARAISPASETSTDRQSTTSSEGHSSSPSRPFRGCDRARPDCLRRSSERL
jgi:hypothetical protein